MIIIGIAHVLNTHHEASCIYTFTTIEAMLLIQMKGKEKNSLLRDNKFTMTYKLNRLQTIHYSFIQKKQTFLLDYVYLFLLFFLY